MSLSNKFSNETQTDSCIGADCNKKSDLQCRHCSTPYCQTCFIDHRRNLLAEMETISEQMLINRRQGVAEVVQFIDKQTVDANQQAQQLLKDTIDRIIRASKNIHRYIEHRRQAKLRRIEESLSKYDQDEQFLLKHVEEKVCLPAKTLMAYRRQYASNMFEKSKVLIEKKSQNSVDPQHEQFFANYRYYDELMHLRHRWIFLQPALTSVYYSEKKEIALDDIFTFLEYRHDRVMENYLTEKTKATCPTSSTLKSSALSQTNIPNNSVNCRKIVQKQFDRKAKKEKCIRLNQQQTGEIFSFGSSDNGIECKDNSEKSGSHTTSKMEVGKEKFLKNKTFFSLSVKPFD